MESDDEVSEVVSEGVSASEDSQVDESMEPPEDMVAAAWLGWLVVVLTKRGRAITVIYTAVFLWTQHHRVRFFLGGWGGRGVGMK